MKKNFNIPFLAFLAWMATLLALTCVNAFGQCVNSGPAPAYRDGVRENPDGSVSTHLYAAETLDGKHWVCFPTLFQNEDGTWVDMSEGDWYDAYEEAKRRGEVIDFGRRKKDALAFGEGSWKK